MTELTAASSEPESEWGPAMRALHTRWQRAVLALFETGGNRSEALRVAGWKADNQNSLAVSACRLFQDDRIRAAVREVGLRYIETTEPELLAVTLDIMRSVKNKAADRLAAARMIWDRANPVINKTKIEVEHHLSSDELDVQHFHALQKLGAPQQAFLDRFGVNGIDRVRALIAADDAKHKVIEADYHEEEMADGER